MLFRRGMVVSALLTALALAGTPAAATAASEAGDRCVGDESLTGWTAAISDNGELFPILPSGIPPEGDKVITSWTVRVAPGMPSMTQKLVILSHASENELRKVAESDPKTVSPGVNTFTTRLHVPEYARVGLYGSEGTLLCDEEEDRSALFLAGDSPLEGIRPYEFQSDIGVPVTVTLEPGPTSSGSSGSGEKCTPANGCPVVELKVSGIAKRRAILVSVKASSPAPVEVTGKVGWRSRRPSQAKARGRTRPLPPMHVVGLQGGSKQVGPDRVTRFRAPLPEAVLRRLAALSPKRSLRARIAVTATDKAEVETTEEIVVKLRGQLREAPSERSGNRKP